MSFLLYKNNIFVFFLSILFLLEGCGGPGTTAARIYEDTFSKKDQVECPDIKLIKELNNYYSRGQNEEVNYVVNLDKVSFECYLEYEESSDKSFVDGLAAQVLGSESKSISRYNSKINLDISFLVSTGNIIENEINASFSYVLVLIDEKEEIIVKKNFLNQFIIDQPYDKFILSEKLIHINLPNINIGAEKYKLLLGFKKI